ncbi:hypothetical protein JZ751_007565 [Albula glossodonta]|uniref:ADP-ribosylation factor-like protein 8A n=1 Tax=Albula glossodonta TaxID=121402 RepID=A0A8T2N9W6_9TELE|nr:hypothetical protein JZ751_007565 [Albula glossodonta]
MIALINKLLDWFKALFWKEEMELTLVGLQYSGKTTFVNVIASGQFSEDMIPTVGFNMRKITKGNVTIKLWDIGGQPRFRSMWERYCRGVSAIVYMVDAADPEKIEASKNELHNLSLSAIQDREICCYSISCKEKDNIVADPALQNTADFLKGFSLKSPPLPSFPKALPVKMVWNPVGVGQFGLEPSGCRAVKFGTLWVQGSLVWNPLGAGQFGLEPSGCGAVRRVRIAEDDTL